MLTNMIVDPCFRLLSLPERKLPLLLPLLLLFRQLDRFTGVQRTLHVLHNSEQPASAFAILESGNKVVPLIADGLFDLLMYKISSVYTNKMQKMESKGPRFEIGDFCVKLGSVTINQNFKGVLVEVRMLKMFKF